MRSIGAVALAAAFALLLGGCVPQSRPVQPKPSPSSSPIFASDEEALAAATKAYAAYLDMEDEIAQDGGNNPDRLAPFVTPEQMVAERKAFTKLLESGKHQLGSTSFRIASLQQSDQNVDGRASVGAYICADISAVSYSGGASGITPTSVPKLIGIEAGFEGETPGSDQLLVARSVPWAGTGIC
ncbi:hypothetical protein [Parafrigoribacterium mesophilum]|uniref:hypothetical protein n=1 Tax=Parafrigoribacterium mesophilum TaxID=433646 RepID=UPI0031FC131D